MKKLKCPGCEKLMKCRTNADFVMAAREFLYDDLAHDQYKIAHDEVLKCKEFKKRDAG